MKIFLIPLAIGVLCAVSGAQPADRDTTGLASVRTFGTMGKESRALDAKGETELFSRQGMGCLTHMWFGGNWPGYERTRIRVYVDGEAAAGIDMELGLGHGVGFGDTAAPWGGSRLGKTGHPSGLYNTYRIPFGTSVRVTARLGDGIKGNPQFWWIVRGSENLPVEIGGVTLPATARLRLHKLVAHTTKPLEEFTMLDTKGDGALYQVTIAARGLRPNMDGKPDDRNISYLEACMRAYIGGAKEPLMLSSGLEDYFLGTYYFNRGRYANDLAGLTHLDRKANTFSAYRFHDEDPVFFQRGLRLTCRCGEKVGDRVIGDPPDTEFTTYAWVYQW